MDPDQQGGSRKRKSPVTSQSASPKRRGPETASSPSRSIEGVEAEAVFPEKQASTSHRPPSSATAFSTEKLITVPSVTLEGDTLGEKHRHFNKLVEDAIANKNYKLRSISSDDSDIDNLLKIEIASRNRNVDDIVHRIEVMKSNDMLYAATAIKKSTWLITDPQYANIINPEYLHTHLLPSMNSKAFKKLMLHIRLNLKDESRVESFYTYLSMLLHNSRAGYCEDLQTLESYSKWLENCSISFIDDSAKTEGISTISLYKRLLKRSAHFIAHQNSVREEFDFDKYEEYLLMFKSQTALVMNKLDDYDFCPELGKKKSKIMMKHCPKKFFDNIRKYIHAVDMSLIAKCLKKNEIKKCLSEQTEETKTDELWHYDYLRHFIKNMPEEERFDFVKKIFIDKTEPLSEHERDINRNIKRYQWFEFAPFNEALTELSKLIRKETSPFERCAMLTILITCARKNPQNIKTLLLFYNNLLFNELFTSKIQFVNNLLSQISTHEFDDETWNVLDQLFHSMEVYTESENDVQMCLESIVLYKVLHDEPVPEIIKEKLSFNTFEKVRRKLNQEQRSKMFNYLFNFVCAKLQSENIANESDFSETIDQLENALTLLRDWGKDISKYPSVLQKIQELVKIRQENKWKTDMSCLYSVKKSWRKHMLEESLSLSLSEETCLNALKHKPTLLMRHDQQIDTLRTDDAVSLRRLLAKLRVYWPHSLAQHFTDACLLHLNKPIGQKAVISGLFTLLPQQQIIDMAKIHAPKNLKINWRETDRTEISIQKNIARHLHLSRPLMPLEVVLWYAKGDYLQNTVPSLNAILSQLNEAESRKYLPKLLDAPVSLQKFGLNLAVTILKSEDLKTTFSKVWKSLKNDTIRVVFFMHTFDKVRYVSSKGRNGSIRQELWEILTTFIDDLTAENCAEIQNIFLNFNLYHPCAPRSFFEKLNKKRNEISKSLPASVNLNLESASA